MEDNPPKMGDQKESGPQESERILKRLAYLADVAGKTRSPRGRIAAGWLVFINSIVKNGLRDLQETIFELQNLIVLHNNSIEQDPTVNETFPSLYYGMSEGFIILLGIFTKELNRCNGQVDSEEDTSTSNETSPHPQVDPFNRLIKAELRDDDEISNPPLRISDDEPSTSQWHYESMQKPSSSRRLSGYQQRDFDVHAPITNFNFQKRTMKESRESPDMSISNLDRRAENPYQVRESAQANKRRRATTHFGNNFDEGDDDYEPRQFFASGRAAYPAAAGAAGFSCKKCGKTYSGQKWLATHVAKCEGRARSLDRGEPAAAAAASIFKCRLCSKQLSSKHGLACHMAMHTRGTDGDEEDDEDQPAAAAGGAAAGLFHCNPCGRTFDNKRGFMSHNLQKHGIKFDDVLYTTGSIDSTKRARPETEAEEDDEQEEEEEEETGPFDCDKCEKSYDNKRSLTRHSAIHSGKRPRYSIELADADEGDDQGDGGLVCEWTDCDRTFPNDAGLRRHMLVHTGDRCDLCHKFMAKGKLDEHMMEKHKGESGRAMSEAPPRRDSAPSKVPLSRRSDGAALNRGDSDEEGEDDSATEEGSVVCEHPGCDKTFPTTARMRRHLYVHTGDQCEICSRKMGKDKMDAHMREKHPEVARRASTAKPKGRNPSRGSPVPSDPPSVTPRAKHGTGDHECPTCQARFANKSYLKDHRKKAHGEKPFPCHVCGETFATKHEVVVHRQDVHV